VDGRTVALRVTGDVEDLDADRPLRAVGCDPLEVPEGEHEVRGSAAGPFVVDHLRLAPEGATAPTVTAAGRVVDPGEQGRATRDGIRVDVDRPAWLVVGESFNEGWRATCDGRDLGEPTPLQGYANAWRVEPGCQEVDVAWAPNRWLPPAYLLSLVACLVLLALALRPARRETVPVAVRDALPDAPARPLPLRHAVLAGVAAGLVLGFVFAIRAGVVIAPAVALILWRGWSARTLALTAGALLAVVVPVLYLAISPRDPGGYNSNYAVELIAAHWVGVGAVVLILLSLWRTVARR
jgi:hypothetical protein